MVTLEKIKIIGCQNVNNFSYFQQKCQKLHQQLYLLYAIYRILQQSNLINNQSQFKTKLKNIFMGNKSPQNEFKLTPQLLQQSCQFIIKHQNAVFTKVQVIKHIKIILRSLRERDPIEMRESNLYVNPSFIKFLFNCNFTKQMMKIVQLFMHLLEDVNKKSLNFLKVSQVNDITVIADFILYFSNQKIIETYDSLLVRSDVTDQTKKILKEIQKQQQGGQLEVNGNLIGKISPEEVETIEKTLRVTIINFINLRLQMISRSEAALKYFAYFEQSLFMLYAKLYFSHTKENNIQNLNQHFKSNMIIGSYFLSAGTSYIQPSLYETGTIFLYSFLKLNGVEHKQMKELPSHLFKNLPVIPAHSIYQYILCTILFTLKYIKQGQQTYIRFAFNRIMSLKLVQLLLKSTKIHNKTITYYLQQLCLQVKVGQIERACIYQIIQLYNNLSLSQSEIFKKFLETGNLKYNLKFSDRQIKISKEELLTELQDDEDTCQKEYLITSHKFVLQRILFRAVIYNFNDRLLWNQILPNIMNNKQDEEVRTNSKIKFQKAEDNGSGEEDGQQKKEHVSVLEPQQNTNNKMENAQ